MIRVVYLFLKYFIIFIGTTLKNRPLYDLKTSNLITILLKFIINMFAEHFVRYEETIEHVLIMGNRQFNGLNDIMPFMVEIFNSIFEIVRYITLSSNCNMRAHCEHSVSKHTRINKIKCNQVHII